jgi:hypothetical protein
MRVALRSLFLPLAVAIWPAAIACSEESSKPESGSGPPSGVFGGAGGALASGGSAGASTAAGGSAAGAAAGTGGGGERCLDVPAGTIEPLIDDFEDGDGAIRRVAQREGFWVVTDDGTSGTRTPAAGFETTPGGPGGSLMSARLQASGYTSYGASIGVGLQHVEGGLRCPVNASDYRGIRFDARGPGVINVILDVPGTVPFEYGGSCDPESESCWDGHVTQVVLSDGFRRYELEWSSFAQTGWGKVVAFDSATILGLAFAVAPANLPIDFEVDNVSFMIEPEGDPLPWGGAGGSGGERGEGGEGGQAAGGSDAGGAGGVAGVGGS